MRVLIYFPIIHSGADMGSLAAELNRKGIDEFGKHFWETHVETVRKYWEIIRQYCEINISYTKPVKIYQDGMVVGGEIALKIIADSVKAGSKNYEIVSNLVSKGGIIMQTEDIALVKKEVEMLKSLPSTGSLLNKVIQLIKFKINRYRLLNARDQYIARKIAETLDTDEIGLIFLGAYHNILNKLPKDIQVVEFKEIKKVRAYQKILPFHNRYKQKFGTLSQYITTKDKLSYLHLKYVS